MDYPKDDILFTQEVPKSYILMITTTTKLQLLQQVMVLALEKFFILLKVNMHYTKEHIELFLMRRKSWHGLFITTLVQHSTTT